MATIKKLIKSAPKMRGSLPKKAKNGKVLSKKTIKKAQDGMDYNPASGMSYKPGDIAHIEDIKRKVRLDMHNPLYHERDLAYRKTFNGPQPSKDTPISKEETPFYKKIDASDKARRAKAVENIAVRTRDMEGVPRILKGRNSEGNIEKNGGKILKKKAKTGTTIAKAKDGKWMQKAAASIKKRGTAGKCTPITKPGCTGKAKALAKTFKKIAKSNKKK